RRIFEMFVINYIYKIMAAVWESGKSLWQCAETVKSKLSAFCSAHQSGGFEDKKYFSLLIRNCIKIHPKFHFKMYQKCLFLQRSIII
uniref:Uncharacterized protein n=1 Tax=Malurus cyaneus samueli TaxID=2593467 RepID=A0A8C5UKU0_9PASS